MKKKVFSFFKYLVLLSAGIFLLYLAFRKSGLNLAEFFDRLKAANYWWILLSVFFSLLAYLSRAMRWNMLIRSTGYPVKLPHAFYSLMAGYFANLFLPRAGEIARCGALHRASGVPFSVLLGTVIAERLIDLLTLLVLTVTLFFLQIELLAPLIDELLQNAGTRLTNLYTGYGPWLFLAGIGILSLLTFLVVKGKKQQSGNPKWKQVLTDIWSGMSSVFALRSKGIFFLHTMFIWLMYFLMSWVAFFAVEGTSHLGLMAGFFSLIVGGIGMSAPVQGGTGTFHYLVQGGLELFGVHESDGLIYTWLVWGSQTFFAILLGLLSLYLLLRVAKKAVHEKQA